MNHLPKGDSDEEEEEEEDKGSKGQKKKDPKKRGNKKEDALSDSEMEEDEDEDEDEEDEDDVDDDDTDPPSFSLSPSQEMRAEDMQDISDMISYQRRPAMFDRNSSGRNGKEERRKEVNKDGPLLGEKRSMGSKEGEKKAPEVLKRKNDMIEDDTFIKRRRR